MSTKKEWCAAEFEEPIEITVVNSTEIKKEITVIAFTKNILDDSAKTQFVVWQSLRVQSKAKFEYTSDISVMAERTIEGVTYQSGPFPAKPGDTWIFYQDKKESAPCLQQGIGKNILIILLVLGIMSIDKSAFENTDGEYVIYSLRPLSWLGRTTTFSLCKGNKVFVTQQNVPVGSEVVFSIVPFLFFAIPKTAAQSGDILDVCQDLLDYCVVDISDYVDGLVVTVTWNASTQTYMFSAGPKIV